MDPRPSSARLKRRATGRTCARSRHRGAMKQLTKAVYAARQRSLIETPWKREPPAAAAGFLCSARRSSLAATRESNLSHAARGDKSRYLQCRLLKGHDARAKKKPNTSCNFFSAELCILPALIFPFDPIAIFTPAALSWWVVT